MCSNSTSTYSGHEPNRHQQPGGRRGGARLALTLMSAMSFIAGVSATAMPALAKSVTETFSARTAGSAKTVDHGAWDQLLKAYVKPAKDGVNRVDYKAFKSQGQAALKDYIARLEATDVAALDATEQFAFWANLYNAKTIDIVLDHYPVGSIREIALETSLIGFLKKSVGAGGPWKAEVVKVAGRALSLDNIEHDILRPIFKDPRVHYAVNCASYGCPNLMTDAFTGGKLEAQLDAGARAFVNHPRGIKVDGGRVLASSIYDWFQADFGGSAAGVLGHVGKYASGDIKKALAGKTSIDGYDYDWRLNDAAR